MGRMINFLVGFIAGVVIGASVGLLIAPQSGQEIKAIFQKEFVAKKAELEAQFLRLPSNEPDRP